MALSIRVPQPKGYQIGRERRLPGAGHPVLGDPRYKTDEAVHARWIRKRIALHAMSLGFQHPATGEMMKFESPLPTAMQKFIAGS